MTEVTEPGQEPEMESADLNAILADGQSAPAAKAKAEPAKQEAPPEVKPETPEPETKPEAEQPFWYRKRLKEIEQRAKAAERRAQELEARQEQAPPPPFQNVAEQVQYYRALDRIERSEDRFIDKHGESEFQAVAEWLATRPDIEAIAERERHPWGYAHEQYKVAKLRDEIGDDPSGWTARKEKEIEDRLMAKLAEQGFQSPGQTMTATRPNIPPPASGQRSAAPRGAPAFAGPTPLGAILKS